MSYYANGVKWFHLFPLQFPLTVSGMKQDKFKTAAEPWMKFILRWDQVKSYHPSAEQNNRQNDVLRVKIFSNTASERTILLDLFG